MSKYDWATIQEFYDEGHSFLDITKVFGPANLTINRAVKSGHFISRDKNQRIHASALCVECGAKLPSNRRTYCSSKCAAAANNRAAVIRTTKWRRNARDKIHAGFGSKCGICGIEDHPSIFDLHHLDGEDKEFGVVNRIKAWEKIEAEAKKCVLLCAPCHRKHHAGVLAIPGDIRRYSSEIMVAVGGIEPPTSRV